MGVAPESLRQGLYNHDGLPAAVRPAVRICDVTLREGEQTPGVRLPLEAKLRLAELLDAVGIAQIQLNHVTHTGTEAEAKAIKGLGLRARLEIMTSASRPDWREAISRAIDAGTDIVHTNVAASPHVRFMYAHMDDGALVDRVSAAVDHARSQGGLEIGVTFVDAPRVAPDLLKRLIRAAVEAGATRLRCPDSVGVSTPRGMAALTRLARETAAGGGREVTIGAHCHNDYAFAAANTIAAYEEGATLLDLAVNGLGERAGNADLASVVSVLETIHGCDTGIDLSRLAELSAAVAAASGARVPSNAPIVGAYVFADLEGIHLEAQSRDPFAFQGFQPELVGNRRRCLLGIFAGESSVRAKLDELRLTAPAEALGTIARQVREAARDAPGGLVGDAAFRAMVAAHENDTRTEKRHRYADS